MLLFILILLLTAVALEIFCFSQLSGMSRPETKPVRKAPKVEEEEKKTSLGRPIQIIQIKA